MPRAGTEKPLKIRENNTTPVFIEKNLVQDLSKYLLAKSDDLVWLKISNKNSDWD